MSNHSTSPGIPSDPVSSESNAVTETSQGESGQNVFKIEAMTTRSKDADFMERTKCHCPTLDNGEWILTPLRKASVESRKRPYSCNSSAKEQEELNLPPPPFKKRKNGQEYSHDYYCWICHREDTSLQCELCPRVFHIKCVNLQEDPGGDWVCLDCEKITQSQCTDTQSKAMAMVTIDQLAYLLKFALGRMKHSGAEAFLKPVSLELFPMYDQYIYNPMDLSTLEKNIKKKIYGSTEAFLVDTKWILHNCIVFNGYHHKLTSSAKSIVKICRHEMNEIEICPDCYTNSSIKNDNWFCEPCRDPHILVWAKLQGFPFWPAKALRAANGNVDVRFFGAHDRAWIPDSQCYFLSKTIPSPLKNKKKSGFDQSMEELEIHIQRLTETYGHFEYAPFRTLFDPDNLLKQVDSTHRNSSFSKKEPSTGQKSKTCHRSSKSNQTFKISTKDYSSSKTESNVKLNNRNIKPNSEITLNHIKKEVEVPDIWLQAKINLLSGVAPLDSQIPKVKLVNLDKTKIAPTGVFVSDKLDSSFKSLELNIPKLDKSKISKPSLENIKKLEVLTSSAYDDDEDGGNITTIVSSPQTSLAETVSGKTPSSDKRQFIPINIKDIKKEVESELVLPPSDTVNVQLTPQKKNSLFSIQLDKTIESCKAKLGIQEVAENSLDIIEDTEEDESKLVENRNEEENKNKINDQKDTEEILSSVVKCNNETSNIPGEINSTIEIQSNIKITSDNNTKEVCLPRNISEAETICKYVEKDTKSSDNQISGTTETLKTFGCISNIPKTEKCESNFKKIDNENESKDVETNPVVHTIEKNCQNDNIPKQFSSTAKSSKIFSLNSVKTSSPEPSNVCIAIENASSPSNISIQDEPSLLVDCESENELVIDEETESKLSPILNPIEKHSKSLDISWNNSEKEENLSLLQENKIVTKKTVKKVSKATKRQVHIYEEPVNSSTPDSISSSPAPLAFDFSKYTHKILSSVKNTFEEMIQDFYPLGPSAIPDHSFQKELISLQIEVKKMQWCHQQQLIESKHNADLTILEMRSCVEAEKERMLGDLRRQLEQEKLEIVKETKKRQWCANCGKESLFYCCWNTSYCDYPCQQSHWPEHMLTCTQAQSSENGVETEENDKPAVMKKQPAALSSTPVSTASAVNEQSLVIKEKSIKEEKSIENTKVSSPNIVMMTTNTQSPNVPFIQTHSPNVPFIQTNNITSNSCGTPSAIQLQYVSNLSSSSTLQTFTLAEVPNFPSSLPVKPEVPGQIASTLIQPVSGISPQAKIIYPVISTPRTYKRSQATILPKPILPIQTNTDTSSPNVLPQSLLPIQTNAITSSPTVLPKKVIPIRPSPTTSSSLILQPKSS